MEDMNKYRERTQESRLYMLSDRIEWNNEYGSRQYRQWPVEQLGEDGA